MFFFFLWVKISTNWIAYLGIVKLKGVVCLSFAGVGVRG